jgi:hypothetical protein
VVRDDFCPIRIALVLIPQYRPRHRLERMAIPTEPFPAGSSAAGNNHARVSFPPLEPSSDVDSFGDHSSIGLGPPPLTSRISAGLEVGQTGEYKTEGRRRIKSTNTSGAPSGRSQSYKTARRRTITTAELVRPPKAERGGWNVGSVESSLDELEPGVFSDEYDLCTSFDLRPS